MVSAWKTLVHLHALCFHTERGRREGFLRELSACLKPIWRIFGLTEEQIATFIRASKPFAGLASEVGVFVLDAAQHSISAQYEPTLVYPGTVVDMDSMVIHSCPGPASTSYKVMCTVGLGLRRRSLTPTGDLCTVHLAFTEVVASSV